ncbi:MAG: hypothetical protein FRX48_04102 [Lasallia pustulata]|uniref:Uncharacterized protein n=1 Tax=Lasallia pustulata TaxID=136370 RepID=A0A5M8PSJ6_9LECA|nr:MAG: hypothetical protein FRX48_04102 [Lasallia pustulata]
MHLQARADGLDSPPARAGGRRPAEGAAGHQPVAAQVDVLPDDVVAADEEQLQRGLGVQALHEDDQVGGAVGDAPDDAVAPGGVPGQESAGEESKKQAHFCSVHGPHEIQHEKQKRMLDIGGLFVAVSKRSLADPTV